MLGTFNRGMLNPAMENAVFTQPKGYISDPIRLGNIFEIVKVEEHTNAGQASFDEVEPEINAILSDPIVKPKLRAYLTTLRENAFLQIKAGYIDSGAAPGKDTSWKDPAQLKPQTTTKEAVANQRHFKKFLKVIPYGRPGVKDTGDAAPPETAPVPQTPAKPAESLLNRPNGKTAIQPSQMKSPFVRELKPNEIATAIFLVQRKRSGRSDRRAVSLPAARRPQRRNRRQNVGQRRRGHGHLRPRRFRQGQRAVPAL